MANKKNHITFRLTGNKRPVSWELPITGMLMEKKNQQGHSLGNRLVEYIPGLESPFKEDHTGDEKKRKVFFEYGTLKVDAADKSLLTIIYNHKWHNVQFEKVDEDYDAAKELDKYNQVEKALELINSSDEYEIKANGIILLGRIVKDYTVTRITSLLKKKAFDEPKTIIEEMEKNDYKAKFVGALGLLRGAIEISPDQTSVVWGTTKKEIVRVAVGQNPIDVLGQMLSSNTEQARITLQTIGEETKRSYNRVVNTDGSKEIEELTSTNSKVEDTKSDEIEEETKLEQARADYKELFEKDVPNVKKNDLDWILTKINEEV